MEVQTLRQTETHNALVSLVKKKKKNNNKITEPLLWYKIYEDCLEELCDDMMISVVYLFWT